MTAQPDYEDAYRESAIGMAGDVAVNEMVEHVAEAIYALRFSDLDMNTARDMASAAIEAMREPTQEMIDAAPLDILTDGQAVNTWQAMIDAAKA